MVNNLKVAPLETQASQIVNKFLKKKEEKSLNTAISYKTDIVQFVSSVYNKSVELVTQQDWNSVDEEVVANYFDKMYQEAQDGKIRRKNSTINRKMSSIKELMRYLKRYKVITTDISFLDTIENYIDDTEGVEPFPLDVAWQYAEHILKTDRFKAYEKYCLCLLALDTGLRMEELLSLKKAQFVVEKEYIFLRGRGKGNKKWAKKISHSLYDMILKIDNKGDKIFSLSQKNVIDMMTRAKTKLQHENRNYSFHSFKKTAVTFAYRLTGDIMEAKRVGNHSNLGTVQKYIEEEDFGITGAVSLGDSIDTGLYRKVPHEVLLEGLESLSKGSLFLLNVSLNKLMADK